MPGPVLQLGMTALCAHGGQAMPTQPQPRVLLSGQPALTAGAPFTIVACPQIPPAGPPCATASFTTASLRVQALGQPVLLLDSQAITAPNGVPLIIASAQPRVVAQ